MAEYKWKFVLLGDPDVTVNQSRGINLQFNGYVPLNCPKNAKYLSNLISQKKKVDISSATSSGDLILMFRDVKYKADNSANISLNDSNYQTYLKKPGVHMFQGLTAMASDELQIVDENGQQRSTLSVEIPLYDTMFGDRLTGGKARIDGVLLYGQAYNPMFNDEHRQGDLEKAVPIALILFAPAGTGDKPQINPSGSSKVNTILRVAINMLSGDSANAEIVESQTFKDWSKLAGTMHVVNDGIATSADFIVRGHDVDIAPISDDFAVSGDRTIDVATRMFFSEDPEGTNTDLNVDFGSPARLNVMNYDEVSEGKKPQMMISKVRNWTDDNGYKHASWDGVVESWYSESGEYNDDSSLQSLVLGSVYDVDYVAKDHPAVNIFSDRAGYTSSTERRYAPCSPGATSQGTNLTPGMQERWDERTSFAGAPALFSKNVRALNDTIVINSENVDAAGNFNILGSRGVYVSSNPYKSGNDQSTWYQYQGLIANSNDVKIEDCEEYPDCDSYTREGGSTHPGYFPLQCKTYGNNNVIGSRSVLISSRYPYYDYDGYSHPHEDRQERTFIANCDRVNMNMCDRVIALGLKGVLGNGNSQKTQKRFYQGASKNTWWTTYSSNGNTFTRDSNETEYSLEFNTFTRTEDSVFLGGSVNTTDVKGVVVLGTGCPRSNYYGANIVEGFRATDEEKPIGHAYMVEHSAILGIDNRISCIVPERASKGKFGHWCKGRVSNVYEIGRTLINDVRQQHWIEEQYETVAWLKSEKSISRDNGIAQWDPTTIILGNENAYYVQKGKWIKQIVVGGFRGSKGLKGANKSWGYLPYWKYNSFEFKTEWNGPSRNALAIQDLKGRQVLYTSQGINLGFIKGARNDQSYEGYQYSDMGNINLFKLYRLLKHLYYDFETGYVKFSMTPDAEDGKTPQDSIIYPVKFHTTAPGTGNDGKDTCLADLVDDRFCYFPNFPIGDPYSNGGGTYTTPAVGGGDCTDWGNSSSSSSS